MEIVCGELGSYYAPKVLAWNSSSSSPIASPFILMQCLQNIPLSPVGTISREYKQVMLSDICWLQYLFALRTFSRIGSLYFKEDVSSELQDRPLYLSDERVDTVSSFARYSQQHLSEIHQLFGKCIAVAPHLAPPADSSLLPPILAHSDMSASNMLIESPEKPLIACFLDWQGAIVAPVFMQASIPHPLEEQEYLRLHHNLLSRYWFYLAQLPKLVPIHAAAAWRYTHQVASDLPLHVPRCWADGPLKLRDASMKISDLNSWAEFSTVSCVIDLPLAERGAHDEELRARVRYQGMIGEVGGVCGG
ncbi:hypothetical protein F5146DRAFT_1221025 [Armillaria mellea]|nr:hypothetical protein F5146DRAFT_1221025 [Armillaria mellea]